MAAADIATIDAAEKGGGDDEPKTAGADAAVEPGEAEESNAEIACAPEKAIPAADTQAACEGDDRDLKEQQEIAPEVSEPPSSVLPEAPPTTGPPIATFGDADDKDLPSVQPTCPEPLSAEAPVAPQVENDSVPEESRAAVSPKREKPKKVVPAPVPAKPKPPPEPKIYAPITGPRPQVGEGREEISGGGFYEGPFRFGRRHGAGLLVLNASGTDRYEGQFQDEFFHGHGRRQWPDGTAYEGQWEKGAKSGQGVLEEPKGRRYQGQWKQGKRHGQGIQVFDEETRYEGRWQNGLQHGTGKFFHTQSGRVFEGQWICGAHHGNGLLKMNDGSRQSLQCFHGMLTAKKDLWSPLSS
eukprot:gnl/TRDRNA2_/TRDRNA2_63553_c0_seq1.p1 gnl/TRDRNA2_/TRDRNA2_63553_c0~~gnl/TRDRNA2_/TRDRNA2_63553_c0_seq1.p1  ORF type:complete len:396 (-),score=64.48 gnl/TRDRNA2_/TRDRNA2_63553_c0_seq1:21-1082(-)